MFFKEANHVPCPEAGFCLPSLLREIDKSIAIKLRDEDERPVNGFPLNNIGKGLVNRALSRGAAEKPADANGLRAPNAARGVPMQVLYDQWTVAGLLLEAPWGERG